MKAVAVLVAIALALALQTTLARFLVGGTAALDLVLVWGLIGAMMLAAHWLDRWYVYALAAVIVGSRQNALATVSG